MNDKEFLLVLAECDKMLKFYASKYSAKMHVPYDLMLSVGQIRIWQLWQHFDRSKKIKFTTFVRKAVSGAMCDAAWYELGVTRPRPTYKPIQPKFCSLEDVIQKLSYEIDNEFDTYKYLFKAIESLSPRHKKVVSLLYFKGLKQQVVADIIGTTLGTIGAEIGAIKKKLKRYLNEKHNINSFSHIAD